MSEYNPKNDAATKGELSQATMTVFVSLMLVIAFVAMGENCSEAQITDRLKAAEKRIEALEFNEKLRR